MPTLSKPINIPGPWAYNGDKNTIPDTGADVGLASWAQGWGLVNQLPLTAGGIPPARADFNGALNALSAHVYYQQSGAYYDWSADLMYPFPARVLGSDGKVYDWVSASGVGTSAGAQDPTTDNDRTWWTPAVTGGDLPEFDGTTIKLINDKYGVPEFTAPTASAPGKAGLVPGPEATPENELLLRFFSARGWGKLAPQFFDRVWTTEGADTLTLGIIAVPNDTNIDTLTTPGRYFCSQFQSVFGAHAGTVEVYYLKGSTSDGQRSALQIYYCDAGFVAARGSSNLFPVDGTPSFTPTWTIWSAPRPQTAEGVGQWIGISSLSSSYTLPPGGVWAYNLTGFVAGQGLVTEQRTSVSAGGTVITATEPQTTVWGGFIWRIA